MGLWGLFKQDAQPAAKFVEGRVGYAVGDVHGRVDLLTKMLDLLEARAEADKRGGGEPIVVFLGDYVDRGPRSADVLNLLLEQRPHGFERHYLKGNHEQSMLSFLEDPLANRGWVMHGGAETLRAYGVQPPQTVGGDDLAWLLAADQLRLKLPDAHRAFLEGLERMAVLGDYAFVHAGIDSARTIEEQLDQDLLWARGRFLADKKRYSHRIVHGHTPVDQPYADQRRVAVDTGAYASGTLSAARFEGEDVSFISVSSRG
ncbi:MAG TPA: metallophosphoesterase family protein [Caulobacterales bacterium]|nr:metallophosphoesterase family protein [Caulobacterales bacterium]